MSSDAASSRVLIPHDVQKIIEGIKEIIGKQHTDDEIYAVLKECSMGPDESTHKLLDLDDFHEVRKRRERNKEGFNNRTSKDSRSKKKQVGQGRKGKATSSGYSSHLSDRGHESSPRLVSHKTKADTKSQATRVSTVALSDSGLSVPKCCSAVTDGSNALNFKPQAVDAATSLRVKIVGSVTSIDKGKSLSSSDQVQAFASSTHVSGGLSSSSVAVLVQSIVQSPSVDWVNEDTNVVQTNHLPKTSLFSSSLSGSLKSPSCCGSQPAPVSGTTNALEASEAGVKSSTKWRQNVVFQDNFQVLEALKSSLTFGSFRNFSLIETSSGATSYDNTNSASLESSPGNDGVITSSNQGVLAYRVFMVPYNGNANFHYVSSPSQSPTTHHSSMHVTPQPVAVSIQPHQHNFLPHNHFYQPIYVFPMHQYMGHNGIPQIVAGGNMYLSPQDASTSHFGIPSGTLFTPIGNPGSSIVNEDLNEDHTYTTGQMGEDSVVWIPALCQSLSNMQVTPTHNLFPHGHSTVYQAAPTAASLSNLSRFDRLVKNVAA